MATAHAQPARLTRWDWRATTRSVLLQAILVLAASNAYRLVRSLSEGARPAALRNGESLLRFERVLGIDVEMGIQSFVLRHDLLIDVFNRIYVLMFWPGVTGTLLLLFVFSRANYRIYRNALFISGAAGLVVFALYPAAPPRMLAGFVDTVHVFTDSTSLARPGNFTNEYAAMPSFHVGWLVLAGVAAMPAVSWRWARPLLLIPAIVMTITVMATANHYLIDAVAGAAVALGALWVARRLPSAEAVRGRIASVVPGRRAPLATRHR